MRALHDVPAPAKLNLFLHVTGRRADGYHLLQSVFVLIDWCDTLHFELRPAGQLSREDLSAALPPDDLCLRAARALQRATGCAEGAHIAIDKGVPAQAGMGGGSSDAASTLLALNRLWRLGLTRAQLQAIGLTLGADVPFFLCGANAWVEGIGDIIRPLELRHALLPERFVVVKPQAGLDTKAIFSSPLLKRDSERATISDFAAAPNRFSRNDLQPAAQALCPEVGQALRWLASKGLAGRMTGSGSAVFAQMAHAVDLFDAPAAWQIRVCENLGLHPLAGWVRD
ncbi:4-(cytidine 5'-diphospho)-2-C-methyl-D-erythritol kinase [Melaminivora suipulveris]|uniref:4-diphosphocytidyl-2-C-methyl-D-erythritol kinase n=1 Tax=Melaminivora suipulveris TaxID=2109913 RepID=A0A2R3QE98_9BURK|nr:4-(cytidine 5'-diphospho)-2-C-methyl-D-erythritol kinase [Melaminivora suipulveris]AVO50095.1 4-(cytidine 5'-diphospho)-2-C-methyl-D-erythritol kinase [Melaminivora suipulveris]